MKRTILILVGLLLASGGAFAGDLVEGVAAYNRGDYATAFSKFRNLAEQGNASAQFNLALMYDKGDGVPGGRYSRSQPANSSWRGCRDQFARAAGEAVKGRIVPDDESP